MKNLFVMLGACAALFVVPSSSAFGALRASSGQVELDATGPAGMTIVGKGNEVAVREEGGVVTVVVGLASLDTGIALRNKHMREKYLETSRHPSALLAVQRADLRFDLGRATATGRLTLHGRTRPLGFTYDVVGKDGASTRVVGRARIDMRDFGIEVPKYLGVAVKPEVDIVVSFVAHDE